MKSTTAVQGSLGLLALLCACVTSRPDHFYILSVQPAGPAEARVAQAERATLRVTVPEWVDRPEIVLNTSAEGVTVLEHERWAAPLADLVAHTLARDIERRRADVLVGSAFSGLPAGGAIAMSVNIVQVTLRRGDHAVIEAHWRIVDAATATDVSGIDVFSAPLEAESYAAAAQSMSECVGALAERLAGQLPHSH